MPALPKVVPEANRFTLKPVKVWLVTLLCIQGIKHTATKAMQANRAV